MKQCFLGTVGTVCLSGLRPQNGVLWRLKVKPSIFMIPSQPTILAKIKPGITLLWIMPSGNPRDTPEYLSVTKDCDSWQNRLQKLIIYGYLPLHWTELKPVAYPLIQFTQTSGLALHWVQLGWHPTSET